MSGLALFHPDGEVVEAVDAISLLYAAGVPNVRDADTETLAATDEKLTELKRIADEAALLVSDENVRRLDLAASWTYHVGPYTIKSSSPAAGSVAYDLDDLRVALADLVTRGLISADGANGAVETIQPTAAVPYALLRALRAGLDCELDPPNYDRLVRLLDDLLAGVTRLLKLGGEVAEAITACQVAVQPARRKAKVTRA